MLAMHSSYRRSLPLLRLAFFAFFSLGALSTPALAQELSITTSLFDAPGNMALAGDNFRYRVTYACNLVVGDCGDATVTVDLPPEVEFVDNFFPPGDVLSAVHDGSPMGGTVTFTFQPFVAAGNAGDIDVTARFPAGSTPDGTTTTMLTDAATSMGPGLVPTMADLPPVTAGATPMADINVALQDGFLDSCQSPGPPGAFPSTYEVSIGPADVPGSLNFESVTQLVLTLPAGVDMVVPNDGGVYNMAMNTVTWSSLGPVAVGATLMVSVDLNFPQPPFSDGQMVTATADALVDALDAPPDPALVPFGPLNFIDTVSIFGEIAEATVAKVFADGRPVSLPPAEGQAFAYDVSIANTGNLSLDTLSVIDDGDGALGVIDAGIDISRVTTGAYSPAPTSVTINVTTNMANVFTVTSPNGMSNTPLDVAAMLVAGERAERIEWVFNGGAPVGMAPTTQARVDATANVGFPAGTMVDNHVTATWTATPGMPGPCGGVVPPPAGSDTDNFPYTVGDSYTYLDPRKNETTTGPYFPGDTVSFSFDVTNDVLANDAATGVVVTDLLPEFLDFQTGTNAQDFTLAPGVSLALFEDIDNYNGTGRTLLRWTLMGDLDPDETAVITFDTELLVGALFGTLNNTVGMTYPAGIPQVCAGGSSTDPADLDGDAATGDILCSDEEGVEVAAIAALPSIKFVQGQCDPSFASPGTGTSLPGGIVDWRVEIGNSQTVPMGNFVIIDILPFVGDTGVRDTTPRLSLFDPLLIEPVTPPPGGTVFYSLSGNPCRPEVAGPTSGCDPPAWTTIPPTPITATRAIKVEFGSLVLNPLDVLEFSWRMILPADAPIDGSEAFNSFAYGSTRQDDGGFLGAEPNKVGIDATCAPVAPDDAMLGDFVWLDVNGDGDQDGGAEVGVNNVPVQLFDPGPDGMPRTGDDVMVLSSITADDDMGNPGWYKFSALSPGDYYVQFFPPPNFTVTVQGVGGAALDSDTDPVSACTDVVTLAASEVNLDVDMGLLAPVMASLGDYVWFDRDGDGIQNEPLNDGVNGVAVKLFVDDGDNSSEPGADDGTPLQVTVTADDAFGNPGFYEFTGLVPGTPYFVQFMLPPTVTGFTTPEAGSDLAIDSSARPSDGTTRVVTLAPGQHNPTLDAGFVLPTGTLSLGNVVWMDDGDDVFDSLSVGDMPLNGVRLNLYRDLDTNGLPQVNEYFGSTSTATLTGKDGRYRFDNLPAGDYIVEIPASNFAAGEPLEGKISVPFSTVDPNDDVDHDDSGDNLATAVVSPPITLSVDGEPTPDADDDTGDDDNIHFALDFGFVPGMLTDFDFGDAPDAGAGTAQGNYETTAFDTGAFHELLGPMGPYLGDCVDSDNGMQQSFPATADDLGGALTITHGACATAGDDEDGVTFAPSLLMVGGTIDVTLSSSSATACLVSGWIDWNQDGVFDDFAPEKILTDVAAGLFPAIPIPPTAVPGFTYARFRCSTGGGDPPIGPSPDGEVEDYRLQLMGVDLGDAPDTYGTLLPGGAVHNTDPNVEFYLGSCVDTELDGQPSVLADADDMTLGTSRIGDCIDDEDGVTFDTMLVRGQMATITVTASMAGRLDAWVDFDRGMGNGFIVGDQILTDVALAAGPNVFVFAVPPLADVGLSYARFRFSSAGGLAPGGMATDGEVEDYAVIIKGFDFGDLPDVPYPTLLSSGGAQHIVDPGGSVYLGPPFNGCADVEDDGVPTVLANGDDLNPTLNTGADAGTCDTADDEDGVTFDTMLVACQQASITVIAATGAGRLDAWIDFDPVASPGFDATDQIVTNMALANGTNVLSISVPCTAEVNVTSYARFRFSTAGGLGVSGLAMDGEVEDYTVFLKGSDFGDAPDSYGTTSASPVGLGARHGVDPRPGNEFVLGACADTELNGPAAGMATDDDGSLSTSAAGTCAVADDDEDGVTFDAGMAMAVACSTGNGLTVSLLNNAGFATPRFDAWIDWDGSGTFDHPAEHLFGGTSAALTGPSTNLTYDVPCTALPQTVSYARFRLSAAGGLPPTGAAFEGEVEDYAFEVKGLDLGDAPDTYPTTFVAGGPHHTVAPALGLFLGACVDTESDGQPGVSAADDDGGAGSSFQGAGPCADDEDGVVFDTQVTACQMATVTVTSSAGGLLNAFLDFDADGVFDLPRDQIFTDEPLVAGANALNFFAPCDASDSNTYARFRVNTAGGLSFSGPAADGEVEDYLVLVEESDFGDAPDSYGTTVAMGGPLHGLDGGADLYLGACVDAEIDGQPLVGATGDDTGAGLSALGVCAGPDDEDGVVFDTMVVACQTAQITVTASVGGGLLDAWIDLDASLDFTGPADQIYVSQPLAAGANVLNFPVPCDASPSASYARFRVSTAGGLASGGPTVDGEVEDYAVTVKGVDFGDAPDTFDTTFAVTGAYHAVDPTAGFHLGTCVDTEADGQPSTDADSDDQVAGISTVGTCISGDDEDGVTFDTMLIACLQADITVTSSGAGFLDAWIDFDRDGSFNPAADQVFASQPVGVGVTPLSFTVPCTAVAGTSHARFRLSSVGSLPFNGPAADGEVEDYTVLLKGLDYGDAPGPIYPTLLASNGARHPVLPTGNPTLGALVDTEIEGQPNANHLGDDSGGSDDEDGVTFFGMLIPGTDDQIEITTGATGGIVSAWIDFNGDGDWSDAGEQVVTDLSLAANLTTAEIFPVPVGSTAGRTCVRVRISTVGGLGPVGMAMDGEVEDHGVDIGLEIPAIGVAKEARDIVSKGSGIALVTFELRLENAGNVALTEVNAILDLATTFADAASFTILAVSSSDFIVNPLYDGDTVLDVLDMGNTLALSAMGTVEVMVRLDTGFHAGPYECSTLATGTSPDDVVVTDMSQDGGDPDPDGDGDPPDNHDPTVLIFPIDVPTLGEWGLIVLILMTVFIGLRGIRRRRA